MTVTQGIELLLGQRYSFFHRTALLVLQRIRNCSIHSRPHCFHCTLYPTKGLSQADCPTSWKAYYLLSLHYYQLTTYRYILVGLSRKMIRCWQTLCFFGFKLSIHYCETIISLNIELTATTVSHAYCSSLSDIS